MRCASCGAYFSAHGRKRYCSTTCRVTAHRVREASRPSLPFDPDDEIPPDPDFGEVTYVGGVLTIRDPGESLTRGVVNDGWHGPHD